MEGEEAWFEHFGDQIIYSTISTARQANLSDSYKRKVITVF